MSKKSHAKATAAAQEPAPEAIETPVAETAQAALGSRDEEAADAPDPRDDELVKLRQELLAFNDRWLRKVAEFDNFRRRTAREGAELAARAVERAASALLPALDDLERIQAQPVEGPSAEAIAKAVGMVADKFRGGLESLGVQAFESVGQPFDPERHDALTTQSLDDREDGEVLEEFLKGYRVGDRVMRHAQVIVNRRA